MGAARYGTGTWKLFALGLFLLTRGEFSPCSAQAPAEATGAAEVVCRVEGQSTIGSIVPEGSLVQKGQLVCELDSSELRDQLATQQTVVKRAEAALDVAKKARVFAESALKEYTETTFKKELEEAKGQVAKTEDDLADMSGRIDWALQMWEQVKLSKESKVTEELGFQRTKFDIERAQTQLVILQNLTRPRILNTRNGELSRAQSFERILENVLKLEKAKEDKIRQEIAACRIVAPIEGKVRLERPDLRAIVREQEVLAQELSALQDLAAEQQIALQAAEADQQNAVNHLQTAELAMSEYRDGTMMYQLAAAMARIKQAEIELARAQQSVEWSKQMVLKGLIEMPEKVLRDRWLESAKQVLEQAQKKHKAIRAEDKEKSISLLGGDVERSKIAQRVAEAMLELERAREARVREKLGTVRKQETPEGKPVLAPLELKAGSHVRDGQVLARILVDKASAKP